MTTSPTLQEKLQGVLQGEMNVTWSHMKKDLSKGKYMGSHKANMQLFILYLFPAWFKRIVHLKEKLV